jgi:hypothetical protein
LAAHYRTLQPPVVNLNLVTVVRPTAPAAPIDSMPVRSAGWLPSLEAYESPQHTNISASIAAPTPRLHQTG